MVSTVPVDLMQDAETSQNDHARGGTLGAQGRRRALELATEAEAEREALAAELLADLNRRRVRSIA
jgi:hypothetical protein